jgi:hypothetical protein
VSTNELYGEHGSSVAAALPAIFIRLELHWRFVSNISDIWWGVALMLVIAVPLGWAAYWQSMFVGGLLKDIFGDRYMNSWLSRGYRHSLRMKPRDVWLMCTGGGVAGVVFFLALMYFLSKY